MNPVSDVKQPARNFEVPGVAQVCEGNGGLQRVLINSSRAKGEIYLHGAHVTSWCPQGQEETLFVSSKTRWQDGQAIRGGIPICFPWFRGKTDDPHAPAHGFVRTRAWQLESVIESDSGVSVTMFTKSDDLSRRWWPGEFRLVHRATFGSVLKLELICTNTGATAFRFAEALHTYNRVADAANVRIEGLDGTRYLDNTDSNQEKVQSGEIKIALQTDNAFLDTGSTVDVVDPGLRRRIRLEKINSRTTIVWNPWREAAAKMQDLGEGEWGSFVCVEASNILDAAITLGPGQKHEMIAELSVERL